MQSILCGGLCCIESRHQNDVEVADKQECVLVGISRSEYYSEERSLQHWFNVHLYITIEPNSWSRRFMNTEVNLVIAVCSKKALPILQLHPALCS